MSTVQNIPQSSSLSNSKRDEDIQLILSLLQNRVDELKDDVYVSKELLQNGVKTELSSEIEGTLENPIRAMTSVKKDIDGKIASLITTILKGLFEAHKEIIKEAYKTSQASYPSHLHFCIVLREDNAQNRNRIFNILDWYDSYEFAPYFQVDFQFVPEELASCLSYSEKFTF